MMPHELLVSDLNSYNHAIGNIEHEGEKISDIVKNIIYDLAGISDFSIQDIIHKTKSEIISNIFLIRPIEIDDYKKIN